VEEAVASVLSQTTPFDELLVVDDASTDDSATVLSQISKREKRVKVIRHERNLGQLAAFETAILQSSSEFLFLLDADDVYAPDYLATAIEIYRRLPHCDFLFCRNIKFSNEAPSSWYQQTPTCRTTPKVTDLGLTLVRTIERRPFIGAPTSCLSMRSRVAARLFPLPLHEDWLTRADDCLVFGASLAGARKFRIEADLVGYRMHAKNAYAENRQLGEPSVFFLRQVALNRLISVLRQRFHLTEDVAQLAHLEFKTLPAPRFADLREYSGYVLKNGAKDCGRLRGMSLMVKWYLNSIFSGHPRKAAS
jgi:glycosyltransferase involved in cell wall biosynthesis